MTLIKALKEKALVLYVLTFVTGIGLYSAILIARHLNHPDATSTLVIYFISVYVLLAGYQIIKVYQRIKAELEGMKDELMDICSFEEVRELVRYAAIHGINKEKDNEKGSLLSRLTALLEEWENQTKLADDKMSDVVVLYSELNLLTPENVTGKTLRDSLKVDKVTRPIRRVTWIIFTLVLLHVFLKSWLMDIAEPEEGFLYYLIAFQRYILDTSTPFLWGAMGSCVYLLKIFSDLAESHTFNENKMQGWGTRITLGAVLGGVVQFLYDSTVFTNNGLKLDANAIGFLTGIGVKVVYGALEKTIESLSKVMNLDSLKKEKRSYDDIRRYLNEKLALLSENPDDQRTRKVIQEILSEINSKS